MKLLTHTFQLAFEILRFLFHADERKKIEGAQFAKPSEYGAFLNGRHRGLLLDGQGLKLSESDSFQNVCVIARVGAGKTSRYIIPNVLNRAEENCSLVINDPKGEVYQYTSQFLTDRGFRVVVLDPEHLARSSRFNPLLEVRNDIEFEQLAELLVKCGNPDDKDSFWNKGAARFVGLFLKCLKNAERDSPGYFTLHNLYFLFQNFGSDGRGLDEFMARYTVYPDDPDNPTLWNEWKGILTGNEEGVRSFVLNALTALRALSNPNIAKLTASSDFDLAAIRRQKTVIYFITPPQHLEYYSFLISVFFRTVFNVCMRELPDKQTLPVYVLYDEFGHSMIPNFVSTANTIRGYRVSLSIVLQSIAQLNAQYGREYAYSIQGGFNTYMTYSGSDPETVKFFETISGRQRITQTNGAKNPVEHYRESNLINANEVRTIPSGKALLISSNRQPILLNTSPYFEVGRWSRATKRGAVQVENPRPDRLEYVRL
ncbi:MAG: type IV secretory system conjugative DNA transfer family protein [Candidatus Saccharimonadales bacterium]|mgnify:CR=1 FL=1